MLNTQYFISILNKGLFERILLENKKSTHYNLPEKNLDFLEKSLIKQGWNQKLML